jgi:hypothetical protein
MEIEITSYVEDTDILQFVSEKNQSKVIENIFDECTEEQQRKFISNLDDSYLIEELERRNFLVFNIKQQ